MWELGDCSHLSNVMEFPSTFWWKLPLFPFPISVQRHFSFRTYIERLKLKWWQICFQPLLWNANSFSALILLGNYYAWSVCEELVTHLCIPAKMLWNNWRKAAFWDNLFSSQSHSTTRTESQKEMMVVWPQFIIFWFSSFVYQFVCCIQWDCIDREINW